MSELPPPRVHGEKNGECQECHGRIHFWPAPAAGDRDPIEGTPVEGEWRHLDAADWLDNPHEPIPVEEQST